MGKGNDFWLDDPEWEMLRRKAEKRHVSKKLKKQVAAQRPPAKIRRDEPRIKPQVRKETTEKEVVVNLKFRLPKVKRPDFKSLFRRHKKKIIKFGSIAAVVLLIFGSAQIIAAYRRAEEAKKPVAPEEQAQEAFNPLLPLAGLTDATGKKVDQPEIKYDKDKKVLGLKTEYNGVNLIISQQALPDQLKTNPGQIEGIARSVNATTPIETQKGMAYVTSVDEESEDVTYAQIAVFATNEVLVFIKSNKELDKEDWKFYINQLNPGQ